MLDEDIGATASGVGVGGGGSLEATIGRWRAKSHCDGWLEASAAIGMKGGDARRESFGGETGIVLHAAVAAARGLRAATAAMGRCVCRLNAG